MKKVLLNYFRETKETEDKTILFLLCQHSIRKDLMYSIWNVSVPIFLKLTLIMITEYIVEFYCTNKHLPKSNGFITFIENVTSYVFK